MTTSGLAAAEPPEDGPPVGSVLNEERLAVQTVTRAYARARLVIDEVTEELMVPVLIRSQRARLEFLDLTDDPAAGPADRQSAVSPWVTLYAEEPTVEIRRVPTERVRLSVQWVQRQLEIAETLASDAAEIEPSGGPAAGTPDPGRATA